MSKHPSTLLRLTLLCWIVSLLVGASPLSAQFTKPYHIDEIAEGVFAIIWDDLAAYPFEGNHLVVIRDDIVLVVDSNRTPGLADTVIAIVAGRTDRPISHVVNTHWHADHVQGNAVYAARFPEVEIIGHPETAAGIDSVLVPYVAEVRRDVVSARGVVEADTSATGETFSDEERAGALLRLESLEREAVLYDHVVLQGPTLFVADSLVLGSGAREIRVIHPGPANTPGDLVVYLPDEGVLALGDMVTTPYPLLGWDSPVSWYHGLDDLLSRDLSVIVPGHGESMRSFEYAELFRDLFGAVTEQVTAGLEAGRSLDVIQGEVDLREFWRGFAGDNERLLTAFVERMQPTVVERAFTELRRSGR